MEKQQLVEKLLNEKAEMDNRIDLNAYALGLGAMYDALSQDERLLALARWMYWNFDDACDKTAEDYLRDFLSQQ